MNYDKLYYSIIEKAIKEERKALRYIGDNTYYEKHQFKEFSKTIKITQPALTQKLKNIFRFIRFGLKNE